MLMNSIDSDTVSGIRPSFFLACLSRAKQPAGSYADAGYHLAINVRGLIDVNDETIAELDAIAESEDADELLVWLDRVVPRCMALVPRRRRVTFVKGLARALEQQRV